MTETQLDMTKPIVLTPNQVMTALGIAREKLYDLINAGELESYRCGGSRKIMVRSVEAYITKRLNEDGMAGERKPAPRRSKNPAPVECVGVWSIDEAVDISKA